MIELKDAKQKLREDPTRLRAYKIYEKYAAMLKEYTNSKENKGINLIKNTFHPFMIAGKIAEKYGFTLEEYQKFSAKIDEIKSKNPDIELNDLSTQKGRQIIGDIIYETQNDLIFKKADLNSVAVAKCYGLYKAVNDAKGKNDSEKLGILRQNGVTIDQYNTACQKVENYKRNKRRELYDRVRKDKSENIIHMAAAVLEIGPGEAESSLEAFEVIEPNMYECKFNNRIKIKQEEVSRFRLDTIIMNDGLTDDQKKDLIDKEYNKITERNEFLEKEIKQHEDKHEGKMPAKSFMDRNGIIVETDDREVG